MLRLLIADESDAVRMIANRILTDFGFTVSESRLALDALAQCEASLPEVLIVDSALHGALELITTVRSMPMGKSVRILYGVADADLKKLMAAKKAGASDFLLKPFDKKVLSATFAEVLRPFRGLIPDHNPPHFAMTERAPARLAMGLHVSILTMAAGP